MRLSHLAILIALLLVMVGSFEPMAQGGQRAEHILKPARVPMTESGELTISPQDRCPVCAMIVSKHPRFACGMQLKDATTYHFCGTGCLIRTFLHPDAFLSKNRAMIKRMVVKAYFSGRAIDAMTAYWVAGSDVTGPMGPALVPLTDAAAAKSFRRRHGGRVEFRLSDMNEVLWQEITGKKSHP